MYKSAYTYLGALLLSIVSFLPHAVRAQERGDLFKYPEKIIGYTQSGIKKTEDAIEKHLDRKDSLYISPNKYKLTLMVQYTNSYEYYKFTSTGDTRQSITLTPGTGDKLGVYVGWKWLFVGWSFDISKNNAKNDINLSFYTSKIGIDLFYRKRSDRFRISDIDGFHDADGRELGNYNRGFDGISVYQKGINVYYIFNNKRFSYPAAYSQSTNQRISCGSFILGLNYAEQSFNINPGKFDARIQAGMSEALKISDVKYKDYSINFGYTYNWVFAKNCLANISFTPAIGYKNTSFKLEDGSEFIKNINFDFISRAAIVYNNSKWFIGTSFVSHAYSYRKTNLSIVNGFGTINVYMGINLFRR